MDAGHCLKNFAFRLDVRVVKIAHVGGKWEPFERLSQINKYVHQSRN
jgi:hypothetical protein